MAINLFLAKHHVTNPTDPAGNYSARDDAKTRRFTLKAYLPSGDIVAIIRLGLVETADKLQGHMGLMDPWVNGFPIVTITNVYPFKGHEDAPHVNALRLVALVVADLMKVKNKPVAAVLIATPKKKVLSPFYFASSDTSGAILSTNFTSAIKTLVEMVNSDIRWVGALPFSAYLPKGLEQVRLALLLAEASA